MRILLLLSLLVFAGCSSEPPKVPYDTDPTEPDQAAATMELVEGFRLELFAAEPDVVDPVEICFDENGGVYVAEMLDYPYDPESGQEPRSRIRYLEDRDGDGKADFSVIFADKILQATSVFPWKGGVFVASAPDILYLKDTDGDHKADLREIWYTGFDTNVSPEARITNFRFGLDNWIYAANNGRPGTIASPKFPDREPVYVRGFDFRFHPVTGEFAPAAGPTQFGMTFNQWGDRFMSQNTVHLRHAVLPARYVLAGGAYAPDSMLHYVPDDDPRNSKVYPLTQPQKWRVERTKLRQERYDETAPGRVELVGGHFTAATGATVYLGDDYPEEHYGNVFIADANGGLLHRELLFDDGPTHRSEGRPVGKEFLASRDPWFRPVNMANAPDGALYLLDFYREYIEEPASIPEAIKEELQLDFYRGDDRGRIWRIVADGARKGPLAIGKQGAAELVELLAHPNGWHRRTAQRLLLEGQDAAVARLLNGLARDGSSPEARLHALWTLEGLGALEAEDVAAALDDTHARVRSNAVRLAEEFFPELAPKVALMAADEDPKVRFQVALSLSKAPGSRKVLAKMATAEGADPWFRAALLLSSRSEAQRIFTRLLTSHRAFFADDEGAAGRQEFFRGLCAQAGAAATVERLTLFLQAMNSSPRLRNPGWRAAALRGLADGLAIQGRRDWRVPASESAFTRLMSSDAAVRDAAIEAAQYFSLPNMRADARRAVAAKDLDVERRVRAAKFLKGAPYSAVSGVLGGVLASPEPQELQAAAMETLALYDEPEAASLLLAGWQGYGPEARGRALDLLLRRTSWATAFLQAVGEEEIATATVDPVARIRFRQHPDESVRREAESLFGAEASDRASVVAEYADAAEIEANSERGKAVFKEHCANCHMPQGERSRLGPNLAGVNNKSREELLSHILDPSFEVAANYTNYVVTDADGRIYDGLLVGETATSVSLRGEYENVTIPRDRIEEIRASSVSLMPEGLERDMSRQELADVIGYLRAGL